ncbi:MAG: hypothetical protein ACXWUL_03970 [Caldimonas sp.]
MTAENLFSAVLTFSMLAGGTVAFGSDLLGTKTAPAATQTASLPTVTVIGHRAEPDQVTMPTVTVIGRRTMPTQVAVKTASVEQRVQ